MSRTTRKRKQQVYWSAKTKLAWIDDRLEYYYRHPGKYKWVLRTEEECAIELARQQKRNADKLASLTREDRRLISMGLIRSPELSIWVNSKKRVCVPWTKEDVIADAVAEWDKWARDGAMSETGRSSAYKHAASRRVRRANKRLTTNILKGNEYDHIPYPGDYLGKAMIWDYW